MSDKENSYMLELVASPAVKKEIGEDWWREKVTAVIKELDAGESDEAKEFAKTGGPLRRSTVWVNIFENACAGFGPAPVEDVPKDDKVLEMVFRRIANTMLVIVGFADEISDLEKKLEDAGALDGQVPVEVACSQAVGELFSEEEIGEIVENTLHRISHGSEQLDGIKNIATMHSYKHTKSRVDTFSIYIRTGPTAPITLHIGLPEEIKQVQDLFAKTCNEVGSGVHIMKSPRMRAEERRRKRKGKR